MRRGGGAGEDNTIHRTGTRRARRMDRRMHIEGEIARVIVREKSKSVKVVGASLSWVGGFGDRVRHDGQVARLLLPISNLMRLP